MPFLPSRREQRVPVHPDVARKHRGARPWLMICHHRPYNIRPMRPNRDLHHSPLTGFVPTSEVTIHERRHCGSLCPGLGSHGDHGRHYPPPSGTRALPLCTPEARTYFRRASHGVRTRAALLARQILPPKVLSTVLRSQTSNGGPNIVAWAGGQRDRGGGEAQLPTLPCRGYGEGRPRLRLLVTSLPRRCWCVLSPSHALRSLTGCPFDPSPATPPAGPAARGPNSRPESWRAADREGRVCSPGRAPEGQATRG